MNNPAGFHPATARQSVGLVELRGGEEEPIDLPSSEEDLLYFFLATESSRQEMETYTRYVNTVMRQTSQARLEAETKARLKSDFLEAMSREMRAPLNGIIDMTSVLLSRQLGELERDYIETIRQSGEALRGIVDDVLDLSKIESGKLRLERENFDLTLSVSDAVQIAKGTLSEKPLKLVVTHDPRLPAWVRGDAARIRQILLKLLSNAMKFSQQGTIEVKTRVQSIDKDECELLFSVKDEGIGITDEQQRKLFQSGPGLSLAICKRLAELMGGQIGVTSRFGAGSLFWFTVRVQLARQSAE